jgi:hypothetical protein
MIVVARWCFGLARIWRMSIRITWHCEGRNGLCWNRRGGRAGIEGSLELQLFMGMTDRIYGYEGPFLLVSVA